jgi:glutamate dehydrogenase/leucine dehydrogenase
MRAFIYQFKGQYMSGEDVGTTPADMELVRRETPYVAGLATTSGDPSPFTARGVFRAMLAAVPHRWGSGELAGRTVAIHRCGNVGYNLARELQKAGAKLIVANGTAIVFHSSSNAPGPTRIACGIIQDPTSKSQLSWHACGLPKSAAWRCGQ